MPRVKSSAVAKEPPVNAGHARIMGSIPGSGTSGGGNGNPFSVLAWESPWTEETGGLQSMGLQGVAHN